MMKQVILLLLIFVALQGLLVDATCMASNDGGTLINDGTGLVCTDTDKCTGLISECEEVICDGEEACLGTTMTGLKDLQCTGQFACKSATANLESGGKVQCSTPVGINSGACREAIFTTTGTTDISCLGFRACDKANIGTSDSPFRDVICDGELACRTATVFSGSVTCESAEACPSTTMTGLKDLQCTGDLACWSTTAILEGGGKLQCDNTGGGMSACAATSFTTTGTTDVSCLGPRACETANIGTSGSPFRDVICNGDFACEEAVIYSGCVTCDPQGILSCFDCDFNGIVDTCDAPTTPSCEWSSKKKGSSRRRLLSSSAVPLTTDDEEYHAYLAKCGHVIYEVSLYVDPDAHLVAVGVPANDQEDNKNQGLVVECPVGATHAIISKDLATKEILMWHNKDQHASVFGTSADGSLLPMGMFKLSDLTHAYEVASPTKQGHDNRGLYNLVTNNCAAYLINVATELGIKVDTPRVTAFVARRLMEQQGKELADMIRDSVDMLSTLVLKGGGSRRLGQVTDSEIIELLVEHNVEGIRK